jgi:drug/metabolite transporter (DMT)-like permease
MWEALSSRHDHRRGVAFALAAVAVLSPDSLIVRTVDAPDQVVLAWRGGLVAIAMLAIATWHGDVAQRLRAAGGGAVLAGCCWALATILFVYSVRRTEVANTLVIVGAGPVFAATIERLALRDRIPFRTWAASVGVAAGLVWIFAGSAGRGSLDGDAAALGGSLAFAAFLTLLRRGRATDMSPALIVGGGVTAIVALASGGAEVPSTRDVVLLVLLGLLILPVSLLLTMQAARRIRAAEVALLGRLETVLGPLWVWLALGDAPPADVVAAGALIVAVTTAHSIAAIRADARAVEPGETVVASADVVDVDG